ncbi:transcriptional regulator TbsP domain-containing protein, partial [Halorubrum lipolyticum]
PPLLAALAAAYRDAAPAAVDPDLDALRAAARADEDPLSSAAGLQTLTVLARDRVVDALADRFHPATRLAALAEAGVWDLRTLAEPQPNAVFAGRSDGCALVTVAGECEEAAAGRDGDGEGGAWCRIGADATLHERYDGVVADAEPVRIRAPSRHRLYGALRELCGDAVADEAVRLLDADIDADGHADTDADGDPLDRGGARVRTYVAGARRGALDRDLRRACEDAGLGSSATFTRIKRDLVEADLLGTESVSQPVGRPRQRLVARGALADASSPSGALAALRKTGL